MYCEIRKVSRKPAATRDRPGDCLVGIPSGITAGSAKMPDRGLPIRPTPKARFSGTPSRVAPASKAKPEEPP